ncbi:MAG: hypothetical protein Q8O55_12945 [Dehalococcoidales bacterium]|nr:hypothetical protein [Dehalococcoidales bacterium]
MSEYSESELVIPALKFMKDEKVGVTTSSLIAHLIDVMQPSGHDMKILTGRSDTYFSQKVRNLKSHDTITKKNLANYKSIGKQGLWTITQQGLDYLKGIELIVDDSQPEDIAKSLENQGFSPIILQKEAEQDYKGLIIEEGSLDKRTTTQRNRSNKLRSIALEEFKKQHQGELYCVACGFNFSKVYGEVGKNFIELHHSEPVHLMDIEGEKITIEEALKKVFTVCPNCHRIIHRAQPMLSIDDVKKLLLKNKKN